MCIKIPKSELAVCIFLSFVFGWLAGLTQSAIAAGRLF